MQLAGERASLSDGPFPPNSPPNEPTKSKSTKTARARITKAKREKGLRLLQELQFLADTYPPFAKLIAPSIDAVKRETERTYQSDRERLVLALEQGAWTVDDIIDDTRLSRWDVEKILAELESLRLVTKAIRRVRGSNCEYTEFIYTLTHEPPTQTR